MTGTCAAPGAVLTLSEPARSELGQAAPMSEAAPEHGSDWWPLSKVWARQGRHPADAAVVVKPGDAKAVAAVLDICSRHGVPVTPAGARSGVCGGAIPVAGGVALDLTGLDRIVELDETSLTVTVEAGVMGGTLEAWLLERGCSTGHFPQSIDISTVGGWLACRSAGQWSTRYGKVEDMVRGLEVAMADGSLIRLAPQPARSTGPDLLRLFCGSEGTLGVITQATLLVHPSPTHTRHAAFSFSSFTEGLEAIRRVMRRGARPPVIRLYDEPETARQFSSFLQGGCLLLTLTEGEAGLVDWESQVMAEECGTGADEGAVTAWLDHRNDVSQLDAAIDRGFVVDTCEVAGCWSNLASIYEAGIAALEAVEGTVAASAHCSHAYPDGACLYFTLVGHVGDDPAAKDAWYVRAWQSLLEAVTGAGAALSHHHGVGLLRASFMSSELGPALAVLQSVKDALDPKGVMNPGKLGLADRLGVGAPAWPPAEET